MTIVSIFEEAAQEYDAWFDRNRAVYESEIMALKRFLPSAGRGLEIGVGTGRFAVPLGIRVGVEPAAAMAELARRRGIIVIRGLAEALPFRSGSFDLVVMVTVICFIRDPFLALTEAARTLKPGGHIIIGMIDKASPLGRGYEAHKSESKFYRQAHFYTVNQALDWLTKLPFRITQTCQTLFKDLGEITDPESVQTGHGAGGFAVIAAQRT
ncbi:MAG: class I SAM-dependent methyltransferase [Thermodesulfobacteriota bacterium]